MRRDLILGLALFAATLAPATVRAAAISQFQLEQGGVVLQITAPHADIIRVRAGKTTLPEDASWAVSEAARGGRTPMDLTEAGGIVTLRTGAVVVRLERATLRLTIEDAAGRLLLADAPGDALSVSDKGFRLRKLLPDDEHYFGLGDKTGPLDRRGQAFTLWNTDAYGFQESSDPLYKSIPFVLGVSETGQAFGLLLDTPWRSAFDFGKSERHALDLSAEGGGVDYYVMAGPTPKTVVQSYAWLTGAAPLAPLWSLGFQQSRYSYATAGEVRAIADRLRADHIPADVIYLDIDYQDRNRPFTVDTSAFPDLTKLIADLEAEDLRVVLITDLHIADAPGQGYRPYDSGEAAGLFLKTPSGGDYVGEVWPGKAVFPDFSRPAARAWWGGLYADFVKDGVAGFWNDMNEPAIFNVRSRTMPLDTVHRIEEPGFAARAASHAELHNVYGMLNSRATYEGLLKLSPDTRPFVLTRASYAGGQRYAATWTGDNSSSWNHLKLSTSMLVNLGLSGFSYAGDDIGGFAGDQPSADLLTRWIEIGAFNPIFRDHAAKGKAQQEVWVGGSDQEAIRRRYIEERYRLLPYIYALADENSRTGLPLMRPVFLEFPDQVANSIPGSDAAANQFMLGPDLLIAPPSTWESPSPFTVRLPGSGWYDYWTGRLIDQTQVTEAPRLDRLPVFVRPGSIMPRQPLVQSTMQRPQGPLELAVYPGPECHGLLYADDGVSFGYRRGDFLRQTVRCQVAKHGLAIQFEAHQGRFKPWWTSFNIVVHNAAGPAIASLDGRSCAVRFDAQSRTLEISIPDRVDDSLLRIDYTGAPVQ